MSVKTLPKQLVQFKTETSLLSLEDRTIELIASDDSEIDRFSWQRYEPYKLILSHEKNAIDLERVNTGVCLFFDGHPGGFFSSSSRLGKIVSARIDNNRLITKVKLSRNEKADQYLKDVEDGTQPGNSVGLTVTALETVKKATYKVEEDEDGYQRKTLVTPAVMKATKWELQELSAVDIPANPKAGTFSFSEEDREIFSKLPQNTVQFSGDDQEFDLLALEVDETKATLETDKSEEKEETETEIQPKEEIKLMSTSPSVQTQLADENKDLKLQLAALQTDLKEAESKVTLAVIESEYYRLRSQGLSLFAVENKLTEEDFNSYFSSDSKIDLERLKSVDSEDARIELKSIQFSFKRAELKKPIERLSTEKDKAILSNETIVSASATVLKETQFEDDKAKQEREAEEYMKAKYSR